MVFNQNKLPTKKINSYKSENNNVMWRKIYFKFQLRWLLENFAAIFAKCQILKNPNFEALPLAFTDWMLVSV